MRNAFLNLTVLWCYMQIYVSCWACFFSWSRHQPCFSPQCRENSCVLSMKGWGFGSCLFWRHFIDEDKKQWTCTALIRSPVSANISWCFLSRHTELGPVRRSKLLHQGAPCQSRGVGWDVNIWLSTGILTKHTACFSSNYIYPTNAQFALHANEISLFQHSVLMNNNNGAVRIISAWI